MTRRTVIASLVAAAIGVVGNAEPAGAFCNDYEVFGVDVHCAGDGHQQVTADGLPFLRGAFMHDIRDDLVREDRDDTDEAGGGPPVDDDRRHFDSCQFQEARDYIRFRYEQIIDRLDPAEATTARLFSATDKFGRLLHPVQDFYSHSNWSTLLGLDALPGGQIVFDPSYLVDAGTGPFGPNLNRLWDPSSPGSAPALVRDGIVTGELPLVDGVARLPDGWSARMGIYETVPVVTTADGATYRALVTGWNPSPASPADDPASFSGRCLDVRTAADNAWRQPGQPEILPFDFVDGGFGVVDAFSSAPRQAGDFVFCPNTADGELIDGRCPRTSRLVHGGSFNRPCGDDHPRHVCLHQDSSDRPLFEHASRLARFQTGHEWCRLLHLARDSRHGYAASSILLALFAKPRGEGELDNPHPVGTPCQTPNAAVVGRGGPIELTVTPGSITSASVTALEFVLYTGDLRRSIARVSHPDHESGDVDGSDLPTPIKMCVKDSDTAVATVWGWDGVLPEVLPFADFDLRRGVTSVLSGPGFGAGTRSESSADMSVRFDVEVGGSDTDGDTLTDLCGEPFHGTDPADADSDDDDLHDGQEANTTGTDPLDPDSDGDLLEDGCEVNGANPTDPLAADDDGDGLPDGQEDADHDCALDDAETNPADADTDDDALEDGCELGGSNPTDPLVADHDGDGLLDGQEDLDRDCALDAGETNPRDADSDDDGLGDGTEVKAGTDPLDPDSDDDGILDGSDVEWLQQLVDQLPESTFTGRGIRTAILNLLEEAERAVAGRDTARALRKLEELRRHLDGCGNVADPNDWVADCATQQELRGYVDQLIANISAAAATSAGPLAPPTL